MKNSITEIAGIITTQYEENFETMLTDKKDISEFVIEIKKALDKVGTVLITEALQTMDDFVKNDARRKEKWYVKEKSAPNTLATIFGEVHYERTYYKSKETGEFRYLSDELVGIEAYDKMDASLKAKLIEEAIETPYARSGKKASEQITLSSQSVMNAIRELGAIKNQAVEILRKKETPGILYIEADEDHVALQAGGCVEPRLVYVHEGKKREGKDRWKLINPRYFGGVYKESEDLWTEVADYIQTAYDFEQIEKIYLSGDGAAWIKKGGEIIDKSIFVLDKYHLAKAIKIAGAHIPGGEKEIWGAVKAGDRKHATVVFSTIIDATQSETKRQAVCDARTYILNHWKSFKHYNSEEYVGCSAEGHISHIYSDRLSSRPLGWSRKGVNQMARLRVFTANGGDIYAITLKKKQQRVKEAGIIALDLKMTGKKPQKAVGETIDNLPALNAGKKTRLAVLLRGIRGM